MSRVGKQPIPVAQGVKVEVQDGVVTVTGPKGTLSREIVNSEIQVQQEDGRLVVTRGNDEKAQRSMHGLYRTLIANMVTGVSTGFTKTLEIVGVGYRAETKPFGLTLALGFSHPIDYRAPEGITLRAVNPTTVEISGSNKEVVGQVAAEIRSLRPPEPYKGKGVKYQGEVIRRKAGKAGGK